MDDTDYELIPPKSVKPKRTYTRRKAPVVLSSSSEPASSSPNKLKGAGGGAAGLRLEGRKRPRKAQAEASTVKTATTPKVSRRVEFSGINLEVHSKLSSQATSSKRQRPNPASSSKPAISLAPSSPRPQPHAPILAPMPPYGAVPSDPLPSEVDWVKVASNRDLRHKRDCLAIPDEPAPTAPRRSRSRSREGDADTAKPAQRRMSELTKEAKYSVNGLSSALLRSPIALGDKSNLPRGQHRPFTEHLISSPFRAAPLLRPVKLAPKGTRSTKPMAVFQDPSPRSSTTVLNSPLDELLAPGFSLANLLGALPATPSQHGPRLHPPELSTPFGWSPGRRTLADQSLAALRSSPSGGSVIMGHGMDDSSIVLETYDETIAIDELDPTAGKAHVSEGTVDEMDMGEGDTTARPVRVAVDRETVATTPARGIFERQAELSSDCENEPTRGLGLATATGVVELYRGMDLSPAHAPLPSSWLRAPTPGERYLDNKTRTKSVQASSRRQSVVGDGTGWFQALSRLSTPALSFSKPRTNSPVQSPLRISADSSIVSPQMLSFSQLSSSSPILEAEPSSPFPPRRPRQALAPPRPTGPLEHEDDLAYFIATTATGSSDEDDASTTDNTGDLSHQEDEGRWKASAKEIGVGGEENRDALDARKRKLARRKREIGQWMRRGMELRATEGESEDEIRIA